MAGQITRGIGAALMALTLGGGAWAQGMPGMAQGPAQAGVVTLTRADVPVSVTLNGQATAVQDASVRPLIGGVITEIPYEAGREVTAGTPLFIIDPTDYQAQLASAKATLASAEAAVAPAQSNVDRYEKLLGNTVSQEALETARMTLAQAQAQVAVAQAAVGTAQINLDRTTIRSPLDGVPDIAGVSVGDLVTSGQTTVLTTVTAMDPIHVDLSEASARMLDLRARIESGAVKPGDRLAVSLTLENGQSFAGTGTLTSVSSRVSTSTGTVRVRFRFDNPQRLILPGMFVRATVTLGTSQGFLIPQMAASPQADGTVSVWVLDAASKATELRLTPVGTTASAWIVTEGIEDGTRLMVDGTENMIAGTEIAPVPVVLDASGRVLPAAAEAPDPAAADAAQGGN